MKRVLLMSLSLVLLPAIAIAAPTEDAVTLEQLRKTAERGDADAMLEVGILYEFGYRMPDHKPPALAWYRLAAEAGNVKAGARHDALKASMSPKELDDANKLYNEYTAVVRRPAPAAAPVPAAAPTTAPEAPAAK